MAGTPTEQQPTETQRSFVRLVVILLALWAVLRLYFMHVEAHAFWGFNLFHYLPVWAALTLTVVALLATILGTKIKAARARPAKGKQPEKKIKPQPAERIWPLVALIAIGYGAVFLLIRVAWPFLGDGTTYFGYMFQFHESGTLTTQRNATPVLYILYGIYDLYLGLANDQGNSFFPFVVVSCISGIIFVVAALRLSMIFDPQKWMRLLCFALLISLGGTLFFFGYVETYPLQYVFVMLYAYTAYKYLRQRTAKLTTVGIVLALCIAFHLQNLLLIPSFLFLLSIRNDEDRKHAHKKQQVKKLLLVSGGLMIAGYMIVSLTGMAAVEGSPFIPFTSTSGSYTLFSGTHLFDIVNYHFLIAPVAMIILGCALVYFKSLRWDDPFFSYLLINLVFFEAFLVAGGMNLGLGRDWDVAASLGITLALIALVLIRQVAGEEVRRLAIHVSTVALTGVIAWVGLNASIAASTDRYEDLLEYYTPVVDKKITSKGYENLRKYLQGGGDPHAELSTVRTMLALYPNVADARQALVLLSNQRTLTPSMKLEAMEIVNILANLSDSLLVLEEFDDVRAAPPQSELTTTLGDFYSDILVYLYSTGKAISLADALKHGEDFIAKHPSLPYGYETYGYLESYSQEKRHMLNYFRAAMNYDTMRVRPHFYLGLAFSKQGMRAEAIAAFRKGIALDPASRWGLVEYGIYLTKDAADPAEEGYLRELRDRLMQVINSQPQSQLHAESHAQDVASARELLRRVDAKLAELHPPS